MTFPAFIYGFLLAVLCGAGFHFWKAEAVKKLLLYLILAQIGFWVGHIIGTSLGWEFGMIGLLNAGMGIIGAAVFLFVGDWLSKVQVSQK